MESKENSQICLFNAHNEYGKNLYYYKSCDIINQQLIGLLTKIDQNINKKIKGVNCCFDSNKIMLFIDGKIINIAGYNNEIIVEYIISSNNQNSNENNFNLQQIFKLFKEMGYEKFIKRFSLSNLISFQINQNSQYNVEANIYKLTQEGKIEYIPSDKLKVMVLLSIYQINVKKISFNQRQKVYIINPIWLNEYGYKNIKNFIDNNSGIINNFGNFIYDIQSSLKIIQALDTEKMKKYDKDLNSKVQNSEIHFNKSLDLTIKDREIYFSKQFV